MAEPLTPAVFHTLLALTADDLHGYAIMKEVQRLSDGRVRLGPGSVYGTLQRLIEWGWVVEALRAGPKTVDGRARRYYRLTAAGRSAVDAEVQRLRALLRAAQALGGTR